MPPNELGAWAVEGVEAKSGPSEESFCRICSAIAVTMGQKDGKKWTAAIALQPTDLLPPRLLGLQTRLAIIRYFGVSNYRSWRVAEKCRLWKKPWRICTAPEPLHVPQVLTDVPGLAQIGRAHV